MNNDKTISQEMLLRLLRYEPSTGKLFWRTRAVGLFTDGGRSAEHSCRIWNTRYSGKEARALHSKGYLRVVIFNRIYFAHRIIWLMVKGCFPNEIDHISHCKADNRLSNLREVTRSENHKNMSMRSDNKSGFVGVSRDQANNKWTSRIVVAGKNKYLGCYHNIKDAIAARQAANIKYNFHPSHGTNV